mmetsp:Transcript_59722/g.142097  ORF Transcript_59722/g.142097 Transcript_59722/m.142097 type:complete len:421 (-) Transcript_59722:398-1660(-)
MDSVAALDPESLAIGWDAFFEVCQIWSKMGEFPYEEIANMLGDFYPCKKIAWKWVNREPMPLPYWFRLLQVEWARRSVPDSEHHEHRVRAKAQRCCIFFNGPKGCSNENCLQEHECVLCSSVEHGLFDCKQNGEFRCPKMRKVYRQAAELQQRYRLRLTHAEHALADTDDLSWLVGIAAQPRRSLQPLQLQTDPKSVRLAHAPTFESDDAISSLACASTQPAAAAPDAPQPPLPQTSQSASSLTSALPPSKPKPHTQEKQIGKEVHSQIVSTACAADTDAKTTAGTLTRMQVQSIPRPSVGSRQGSASSLAPAKPKPTQLHAAEVGSVRSACPSVRSEASGMSIAATSSNGIHPEQAIGERGSMLQQLHSRLQDQGLTLNDLPAASDQDLLELFREMGFKSMLERTKLLKAVKEEMYRRQ